MDLFEVRVERLEFQVVENIQILKVLEYLVQVNKVEYDNFIYQFVWIEGLFFFEILKNKEEYQLFFVKIEENFEKIIRFEKDMVVIEFVCGKNM